MWPSVQWPLLRRSKWRPFFKEDFVCLFSAERKFRSRRLNLQQYLGLPHVIISVLAGQQTSVDRPLADLGLKRRVTLTVPFFVPAVAAVAHTDLVVTLPRRLAKAIHGMTEVRTAEPPAEIGSFQYFMIWHPRLNAEPLNAGSATSCESSLRAPEKDRRHPPIGMPRSLDSTGRSFFSGRRTSDLDQPALEEPRSASFLTSSKPPDRPRRHNKSALEAGQ